MPKRGALDWALLVTGGAALGAVLTMLFSRDEEEDARAAQQQAEAAVQQSELRQGLVAARAELSELAKLSSQLLAKQQQRMDELETSLAATAAAQARIPVTQADPAELLASLRAEVVPMVAAALDRKLEERQPLAVEQQLSWHGEGAAEGAAAALERYVPLAIGAALREERLKAELHTALQGTSIDSPVASGSPNGCDARASGGSAGASGGGASGGAGASDSEAPGGLAALGAGASVRHTTTIDAPMAPWPPLLPLTPLSPNALTFYPAPLAPAPAPVTSAAATAAALPAAALPAAALPVAALPAAALPTVDMGQASVAAGSCLSGGDPSDPSDPSQPSLTDVTRLLQAREALSPRS